MMDEFYRILREDGYSPSTEVKKKLTRSFLERPISPALRKSLGIKMDKSLDNLRKEQKRTKNKLKTLAKRYSKAVDDWREEKQDVRELVLNELVYTHESFVNLLKETLLDYLADTMQMTNTLTMKKIKKNNRGYADGYLSHYTQVIRKIKSTKLKI